MPASPHDASGALRPSLMKRHSSQSSAGYSKHGVASPGSQGDAAPLQQQNARHHVRGRGHGRLVLPRNHSSGRNLAKMGRHPAAGQHGGAPVVKDDTQKHHGRQRSHEGDTEIRLPGSLDESVGASRPPIARNMTALQLPRNTSHTKLKKNYSHGQLQRLNSGRNLVNMASSNRPPPSPGLKGKSKRPKSADLGKIDVEKDLHQQEVELAIELQAKKEGPKKVGFAVGSSGDTSETDNEVQMDGAGMEEGEWTEESASASPYSTRQNTANNSRRTSMNQSHGPDRVAVANALAMKEAHEMEAVRSKIESQTLEPEAEADGTPADAAEPTSQKKEDDEDEEGDDEEDEDEDEDDSDDDDPPSPRSQPQSKRTSAAPTSGNAPQDLPHRPKPAHRSVSQAAKEHANPSAQFLRRFSGQLPAPAMVSNITAMDNVHSNRGSPAPSMHSSRSTAAPDAEQDELVSRFIPSASHPATSSGANTVMNTPKHSHFHTPEDESTFAAQHRTHSRFQSGPVSPGSTISGSSGTATPALGRSRTEMKMLQEKALADMESANERHPVIPAHVYDRRNESLKSYLNLAALGNADARSISSVPASTSLSLGPEIFQGRFKAVHTELRVVQKFRDPVAESLARLRRCKGSKLSLRALPQKQQAAALRVSKSAVSLPAARAGGGHQVTASMSRIRAPPQPSSAVASFSTSASPPKSSLSPAKPALAGSSSKTAVQVKGAQAAQPRRGVSFAGAPPPAEPARTSQDVGEQSAEAIARKLWEGVGT